MIVEYCIEHEKVQNIMRGNEGAAVYDKSYHLQPKLQMHGQV